jgi:hypothetical protein
MKQLSIPMTATLLSRLASASVLVCAATCGCQSAGPQQQPAQSAVDQRLSQRDDTPEQVVAILDLTGSSEVSPGASGGGQLELESLAVDETVVVVNEDTFADGAHALHFVPVTRHGETLGVRVFFNAAAEAAVEGGTDDTYVGLRRADRIEEIDGLPVASLGALLQAWQRVGWLPEVRVTVRREGQLHAIVYRRRAPGMAASW